MAWDEGQTLTTRWDHACTAVKELHPHWILGNSYTGFTEALVRETPRLTEAIKPRFRTAMKTMAGHAWKTCGWVAFAVDGSRQEAPHTAANEAELGCAGRDKTAPQVFLTTMWHLGLGLPWDYRIGPGTDSERNHAWDMVDDLPPQALLVADGGFVGYELCRKLVCRGRSFLLRVGGNIRLIEKLGYYQCEKNGIVYLWPKDRKRAEKPLVLRLIHLRQGKQTVHLLTNILDPRQLRNTQARALYRLRWGEEVFYRSYKQTLQRRRLLSRTAATCRVESEWTLLGLWLLGLLTVTRILAAHRNAKAWSVAESRDLVRQALRNEPSRRQRGLSLSTALANAVLDGYHRSRGKTARNYPRKKKEKPPGPPRIESAEPEEIRRAKQLEPPNIVRTWAA